MDSLCLTGLWTGLPSPPSWNGFMRVVHNTGEVRSSSTSVEALPFINLNASDLSALYTALTYAQEECKRVGQKNCVVTFDQPLFAKASDIVEAVSPVMDNIILRLGGFHMLMSFLGCIGYTMSGSGLEELWSEVYAKASIVHMMSGHAYSRALRAHLLTEKVLVSLLLESTAAAQDLKDVIRSLHEGALHGEFAADDLADSDALLRLHTALAERKKQVSKSSRTSKLWVQYLQQIEIVRLFIRAERTGNWNLHLHAVKEMLPYFHAAGHFAYAKYSHLYVQKMEDLCLKLSEEEQVKFVHDSMFAVWRHTERPESWGGVWSDMSIEQDLMRAFKVHGGMIHGRGVTDSALAYFVLAFPACLDLCKTLEKFTGKTASSSEQHVDLRDSRRSADSRHAALFMEWLEQRSPWEAADELYSLSSGAKGGSTINCEMALEVGRTLAQNMQGCFGNIKLSRKNRVLPLSTVTRSVTIREEVIPVDTRQLFNRLVWVIQNREGDLIESLKYELAPRPPALFDDVSLRKTAKSALMTLFSSSPAPDKIPEDCNITVDGGHLLHAVVWPRPATYADVIGSYTRYVQRYFSSSACVIFDGYTQTMSTKAEEQRRRASKKKSRDLVVSAEKSTSTNQSDFLSNSHNKGELISMMSVQFRDAGMVVHQADGDADTLIVSTALGQLDAGHSVVVVSTDTDVLAMLIGRAQVKNQELHVLHPGTSKVAGKMFNVGKIQGEIGADMVECILFAHAVSGCDTTSAVFGKGKKRAWNVLKESPEMREVAKVFTNPSSLADAVAKAGEKFLLKIYNGGECTSLDELRCQLFARTLKRRAAVELETLPPTSAACKQHSFRVYLQVSSLRVCLYSKR